MGSIPLELTGQKHIELSYLAGFFDGEGCVLFDRIMVDNTNPHILEKFFIRFGCGRIYLKKPPGDHNRSHYRWVAYGEKARNALREMMPYLIEKKYQALINLDILNHEATSLKRAELKTKIKQLKRVNYDGYEQPAGVC